MFKGFREGRKFMSEMKRIGQIGNLINAHFTAGKWDEALRVYNKEVNDCTRACITLLLDDVRNKGADETLFNPRNQVWAFGYQGAVNIMYCIKEIEKSHSEKVPAKPLVKREGKSK